MIIPLQITGRDIELTEAIEESIRQRAEKLKLFYDQIMRCRVVVEAPHRHQRKGVLYNVRIDIKVPDEELVVKKELNEDLYVAIRDAFDSARRQLQDYSKQRRGEVKYHEESPLARVSKLFPDKGYGFLTAADGQEIYFHKNSVLGGKFANLEIGMQVRYVADLGEKGLQATTVRTT
ncbi:MAG: ribosome-associated translation inhibitor RaiA [Deltaproteobacteria bacterium]|nr:ribosome-associated translation inhibitor RaiA [Deltaproteobacteria bacterium]